MKAVRALLLVGLALPGLARADVDAARDHFKRGLALFGLDDYEGAIREFEAGYKEEPKAEFFYNLGQSHRLAHHPQKAVEFYRKFLRGVPRTPYRAEVEGYIEQLERELAAPPPPAAKAPLPSSATVAPVAAAPAAVAVAAPVAAPAPAARRSRWRLWTGLGVSLAVVAGVAVAVGVVETRPESSVVLPVESAR
jgi:tetratricopeptide (TPR) repeat protein